MAPKRRLSSLRRIVSLHEEHLLKLAPLNFLLVCVADPLVHQLKLRLFLTSDDLFLMLAYLLLECFPALLFQVLLNDLVYS